MQCVHCGEGGGMGRTYEDPGELGHVPHGLPEEDQLHAVAGGVVVLHQAALEPLEELALAALHVP